ncbi:PREDICTED: sprT-like domain-containing protein Spartan [Nicrophorus vespilloides]|uniref:Protein with SprT-like domain at the N terminus n=1 Tax=Nicrophorus vespilloides TaxID=110193 RepID=A0ABM1MW03_NICVS|nr:PREDICTED: sprT-like domain-containing protein Spartan [Nicrophorus vespilloides]
MAETDYRIAVQLQKLFQMDETYSTPKLYTKDQELAAELQKQFEQEQHIEAPTNSLVYKTNKNKDSTKSLVDPSWELIDPTPNIHNLFIAFNQQFFWNKLLAVCVSWSKRMTTCAGICSYQGRGGLCSITLSEPLLKLRPRKDLVETLLHEMIHAFLFVTNNNKDRDGHGPEFHKHMYRINGDAGTNITVYHDFHDEVKLYKTHWWKCDGPCQHRKPFFGMVRRATNRAPNPRDFWWGEHSRTCGGTFIKVKEPEKTEKKKKTSEKENNKPKNAGDIRSYLPTVTKKPSTSTKPTADKILTPKNNTVLPKSNIHGFGGDSVRTGNNNGFNNNANIKNIHGFHDIDKLRKTAGGVSMNAGTIVINKKPSTSTQTDDKPVEKIIIPRFTGSGKALGSSTITSSETSTAISKYINNYGNQINSSLKVDDHYTSVRNHWANRFESQNSKKRLSDEHIQKTPKKPKIADIKTVPCPVCNKQIADSEINRHLDNCLNGTPDANCDQIIDISKDAPDLVECEICNDFMQSDELAKHKEHCMQNISMAFDTSMDYKECDICKSKVDSMIYDVHVASCLMKCYDEVEERYKPEKGDQVPCLVCKKLIAKEQLDKHLDDCMSNENVFESEKEANEFLNDNSLVDEYSNTFEIFDSDSEKDQFLNDTSLIDDYNNSNCN